MPTQNPYSDKLHGALKEAYGDSFSLTEDEFLEKMNSDVAYRDKIYGGFKEAYGDNFTLTPDQFAEKLKKKEVSGQDSDPLTQRLPVKTVPTKVAPKGQATNVKPAPQKQVPTGVQGDPFANQQVPTSVGYDARLVRESIKGVKEGLDKTYRIAQEGKRKGYFDSWNTQQAYTYIKPSVDYTEQMLDKIKNIQDPEIQALYTELKNANTQMKDMVGQAWNDGWDEAGVNQYIGGLSREVSTKLDEVDRRMAKLQQPTEQDKRAQELLRKTPFIEKKYTKEQQQLLEPEETEAEKQAKKELEAIPDFGLRVPDEDELEKYLEGRTYAEKRADFESSPYLKERYGSYEEYMVLSKLGTKYAGEKVSKEQWEEGRDLLDELNANNQIKAQAEKLEANMGKRHKEINLNQRQQNFNKTYDAWISARNEDPESEETKALAEDLKLLEAEYEEGYRSLDLDYLESMAANQPTLAKEKIDRYNQLIAKKAKGETLGDTEAQFLLNVRRDATDAYAVINNAKLIKLREKSDLSGYTKGMAELSVLTQEILGDKSVIQFASEQVAQKAKAAMAPIQAEYGKKRRELSDYEAQLKDIDAQLAQLDAEYQLGMKTQQEYEYGFDQLSSARNNIYGLYSTAYSVVEELNKAMETAIAPFNTEMSKLQDPYNQKIQELNNKITELKRMTGVDDSTLAEAEILYKNLATAQQARINANAQYSDQYYSEEQNKMLQEERKAANSGVIELGKSIMLGLSRVATGLMTLPKGLGLEDSETYGPVDEMYDLARQLEYEAQGTWGPLEGEGVSTYLKYAQSIGQGVASTLIFAGTAGLGAPVVATSVATSIILGAGDNYQRAIDLGMDANEAHFYSTISSGGQALSELIYKDAKVFDDVIGNTFVRNVVKNGLSGKQALRVALKEAPKNLAKAGVSVSMEELEEITALVTDNFVNQSTNLVAGEKYFKDNLSADDFEETAISTGGSTIISRFLFRKSRLDPTSRMALFRSVQEGEKTLNLLRSAGASPDKISQAKKDLDEAKLQLSVVESHSNWKLMNDAQKAYAFDIARQLSLNEKAVKSNAQNGIQDESLNQQNQELRQELNNALNNPEEVQRQEQVKSNTLEVLEAVKNGEDYPQMLTQHPNWNSLSDEQKKEIESLSEDLEEKQREILSLFEVGVESSNTIAQRDEIEGKIAEILNNPVTFKADDKKDVEGISGQVGEGQKPVTTQPIEGTGTETPQAGGVLQAQGQEEVTPTEESDDEAILQAQEDIEERRKQELKENEDRLDDDYMAGSTETVGERINAKYDAELAALGEASEAKKKSIPTTGAAPASTTKTEEVSPEVAKVEERRAAELEAFENDENLTEIDGEQVLLTPDGRITRDTINKKYDKEAQYQKGIADAVAEVKKQQNPEYQAALREAIDADPQATTQVHQMAAENILNGAKAADAIAAAKQEAVQKARAEKARQAMEREGIVSSKEDIKKAIENVTRALRSTGIRVRDPLPPQQFEEERKKAKASETAEGWFRSKTGEIIFSQKALEEGWGTTIVFHEGTHPILNIIRNTDKKLYDRAVKGLRDAAKKEKLNGKPNPLKDVEAWVQKAAGKKTQEQQDDEFMTETIARLASGDIEIKRLPLTLKDKLIEFLNKMAKFMGFKRVFLNSPDYEFRRLANQIATTLAKGEKIEKIVGKRNVKKYEAKFGAQETTSAIFDDVANKLAALGIQIGAGKKKKTNFDVGKALKEYYKKNFKSMKIDDFGKKAVDLTSDYAVDEILFALNKFGNSSGKGWYTEDFEKALNTLAQIDPDIKNDPKVREIATVVIAIASNSTDVLTNLTRVIYAVDKYKKTGKIPTDVGSGKGASAIATGVARYNLLLDKFDGDVEKVKQFMQTVGPIKEVRQQLIDLTGKKSFAQVKKDNLATDPEWNDTEVLPGSILIFGPKIGAFYSNLSGLGGTPTIDRWCIRTIYRYRGDMMAKALPSEIEQFKKENNLEGQSDGSVIALIEDHAKAFNDILTGRGEFKGMPKEERNKALKQFRKGSQIAAKMGNVVNEISDGLNDKIENKAQYSKDFRSFTKKVFEEAQKKIKEQTGQDLQISDIQAILWIYEKELFGAMGVNQRPDSTYSSASQRLVDSIKSGTNTVEDFKNGKAKTDQKSVILEEGPMGDLIPMDSGDYVDGLEQQPDRLNESANIQPSEPRGPKPTKAEIDTYLSEQEFFRSTSPFAWAVDAVSRETLESSSIVENEGTYAVVTEDGDIKGVFNPNVAKQREGIPARKNTLNGLIPKAIAAGGIKLDNFDGRLTELYSKNGFKKVSSVPFNEEYAPEGWVKEEHGTPDVVAMVYDPDNKLDIEFKKFDDYGDMISYRDSFVAQAREAYQNESKGNQRIAKALKVDDIIQPSQPGRFDKNDIPDLIQRSITGIDADLNKGKSLIEAIENNVTNQDWYPLLSDKEKRQFQSVIESAFEEEVAGIPSEQEEAAEIGVDPNTRQITSELEDLYYETRDGNRRQRNQAESRRNEIFRGNPKLSYIYKNFDFLSAQLEERGLLTKSIGCP